MAEPYDARPGREPGQHQAGVYPAGQPWRAPRHGYRQWQDQQQWQDQRQWQGDQEWHGEQQPPGHEQWRGHRRPHGGTPRRDEETARARGTRSRRPDASRWHWLLLVAVIVPLATPLYNRIEPRWLGLPFFYWCQLAFALLSTVIMLTVHLATKGRRRG